MTNGEEPPISVDINDIIKSSVNYVIADDKKELMELLAELKEEVIEDFIDDVLQLEKLIDAFLTDDYLQGKPLLLMIDDSLDGFSIIPKSKQQRLKMSTGDIKSNRYRVHSISTRLDDTQEKGDMLLILKQLAAEELLSAEQFEQLSELEQMDLPTIALAIKDTKVGQGLKFLQRKLNELVKRLHIWFEDLADTGRSDVRNKVGAVLEELLRRNGISHEKYPNINVDNNIL